MNREDAGQDHGQTDRPKVPAEKRLADKENIEMKRAVVIRGVVAVEAALDHLVHEPAVDPFVEVGRLDPEQEKAEESAEEHGERYEFFKADIANADQMDALMTEHPIYAVVNFAAESHVDRSINDPQNFIHTNVVGTSILLDCARRHGVQRFLQISTDEVYGSLGETGKFTEQSPLEASSPYSASKAGADLLALACHKTFGQDVIVTRCSNNYGPYQFPEKLIPLMIINAMRDDKLPVYGDGMNVRDWIHVEDHCAGIVAALFEGKPGAVYNFGGDSEMPNIETVKAILKKLGKPETLITFVTDRLGHDRRYAIDSSFAQRELKWKPLHNFKDSLDSTIDWYQNNRAWWEPLLERTGRH